jgi:hypothetical protein
VHAVPASARLALWRALGAYGAAAAAPPAVFAPPPPFHARLSRPDASALPAHVALLASASAALTWRPQAAPAAALLAWPASSAAAAGAEWTAAVQAVVAAAPGAAHAFVWTGSEAGVAEAETAEAAWLLPRPAAPPPRVLPRRLASANDSGNGTAAAEAETLHLTPEVAAGLLSALLLLLGSAVGFACLAGVQTPTRPHTFMLPVLKES